MAKYIVTICKTETYTTKIEVEADTPAQAESFGIRDAQELMFYWHFIESDMETSAELQEDE